MFLYIIYPIFLHSQRDWTGGIEKSMMRIYNEAMDKEIRGLKSRNGSRLALSLIFLAISGALEAGAIHITSFADRYARSVYPFLVEKIGGLFARTDILVAEIGLYVLLLILLISIFSILRTVFSGREHKLTRITATLTHLILLTSILAFIYVINCGINYRCSTFSSTYGFSREAYSVDDLKAACEYLTDEVIRDRNTVKRDTNGLMIPTDDLKSSSVKEMKRLSKLYPRLDVSYPVPKSPLVPAVLSVQHVRGVYSPFTIEPIYNGDMTGYNLPFTICHELSHLSGFMNESEANFIAWLACHDSDDPSFRYSGNLTAWIYCTNRLASVDRDRYLRLRERLPQEVLNDLSANSRFWAKYPEEIGEMHDRVNDTYLKANGQEEGIRTYGRMVDLVVNFNKGRNAFASDE